MRIKVLHVINSLAVGGAETLLVNTLSVGGLQQYTDNIVVYFNKTSPLQERIEKNIKVYCLQYRNFFHLPMVLIQLRKIIKDNNIDIIHSHLNPAGFYTHLVCPVNVPQVHTLHINYSTDRETGRLKVFLEKYLYFTKKNCNIIFLSDSVKDDFLNTVLFKGKYFVLNNFISDSFFSAKDKEYSHDNVSLRLVAAARLSPVKNFEYLIDIFTHLRNREIYLDIYGTGNIEKYNKLIQEKDVKIRMMGQSSDMSKVLPDYDLFILPSKNEGFPLSVFEAMAFGVPLMLSNIAPVRSIVKENALYFDLDAEKSVADILISILEKRTDINVMAKKAKSYAEQTVRREMYMKKLLGIYGQLKTD